MLFLSRLGILNVRTTDKKIHPEEKEDTISSGVCVFDLTNENYSTLQDDVRYLNII